MKEYLEYEYNMDVCSILSMSEEERQKRVNELNRKMQNIMDSLDNVIATYLNGLTPDNGIEFMVTLSDNSFSIIFKGGFRAIYHHKLDEFSISADMPDYISSYSSKDDDEKRKIIKLYSDMVNNLDMKNVMKDWNELFCNDYRDISNIIKFYKIKK